MKRQYKCISRFFCEPLKRYIPVNTDVFISGERAEITLKNFPSTDNKYNLRLTSYNYEGQDITAWFERVVLLPHSQLQFVRNIPETDDIIGGDYQLDASDVNNDSSVAGLTVKEALEAAAASGGCTVDILANRPAFGNQGALFYATDTAQFFVDTGTAWALVTGGGTGISLNRDLDYYDGNNSPYRADADNYDFQDAASFIHGDDMDVIFKLASQLGNIDANGATMVLIYFMSTAESSKNVVLRLDYTVHDKGEAYNGGTVYGSTYITATPNDSNLTALTTISIPAGNVTANTVEVECRLSRLGTNGSDTHTGDFILKQLLVTN